MDVSDLDDLYEVFNQPSSLVTSTGVLGHSSPPQFSHFEGATPLLDEMGIQRKQMSTFQELLESLSRGVMHLLRLLMPGSLLLHPPNLFELIKQTKKGRGRIKGKR